MDTGTYSPQDLPTLAREAHAASGLTQAEAAERLAVTQPAYNQALSTRAGMDALRRRIVEAFTPFVVEGPHYTLRHKGEAPA